MYFQFSYPILPRVFNLIKARRVWHAGEMLKSNDVKLLVFTLVDYDPKFLMEYDKFQH